jgi:hypothetical protein
MHVRQGVTFAVSTQVVAENPGASFGDVQRILVAKWKGISEVRRGSYNAKAAELNERQAAEHRAVASAGGGLPLTFPTSSVIERLENIGSERLEAADLQRGLVWPSCDTSHGGVPVYLTAVIEYLAAEMIELAGNAASDDARHFVTRKHVEAAISSDDELARLFKKGDGGEEGAAGGTEDEDDEDDEDEELEGLGVVELFEEASKLVAAPGAFAAGGDVVLPQPMLGVRGVYMTPTHSHCARCASLHGQQRPSNRVRSPSHRRC